MLPVTTLHNTANNSKRLADPECPPVLLVPGWQGHSLPAWEAAARTMDA